MSWIEWLAAGLGLISTFMLIKHLRSGWLIQNLSSLIYVYVLWKDQLFVLMGQSLVSILIASYAWWHWSEQAGENQQRVKLLKPTELAGLAVLLGFGTWLIILIMASSGSAWLRAESFVMTSSMAAQALQSRHFRASWGLWLAANLTYAVISAQKQLFPTSGLYFILSALAVWGFWQWRHAKQA